MTAPRFLAILDPSRSGKAAEFAAAAAGLAEFDLTSTTDRLKLFIAGGTSMRILDDGAILIGRAFSKQGIPVRSGPHGRILVEALWGDYVCLIEDPESASVQIVRAPSGGVHAYRVRRDEVTLIASHIDLLRDVGAIEYAVDWQFAAHHLAFLHLRGSATGIAGIDEIFPGDCVTEDAAGSRRTGLWSPWTFARADDRILTLESAAAHVADAVITAVASLASPDDRVLLELSGGLDSSIVAAAIAKAGRSARAVNLVTPGPEGDERYYARLVADHCGIPLAEFRIDADIDLTAPAALTARPALPAMLGPVDAFFGAAARDNDAAAFISGTGGDSVFSSLASATPAIDLLKAKGPGSGIFRVVRDIAGVHDTNVWRVWAIMLGQLRRGPPMLRWKRNTRFLRADRLPETPSDHPWLDEPSDALPGKRAHIRAIMAAYAHLDDYGRHQTAPSIYPLLAQPVVEACLRVPSWLWVSGGLNRAAARAAFADLLPRTVIERRTKGAMDAYCARTFETNRARLKPFLLDGCLADAGLLDREAIESYLSEPIGARDARFYHLLPIADMEAWARAVASAS